MVLTKFCGDEKCLSEDIVYIYGFFFISKTSFCQGNILKAMKYISLNFLK